MLTLVAVKLTEQASYVEDITINDGGKAACGQEKPNCVEVQWLEDSEEIGDNATSISTTGNDTRKEKPDNNNPPLGE